MINSTKNELLLFMNAYFKKIYPEYVRKNKLGDEIPVFIYHHVTADEFEDCLKHLFRNGYTTLTADEHELALDERSRAPDRSVVITFDDGLADVYEVAFPLLKKYDLKAIVFLIPGWIGRQGMITWEQIQEMHDSGVIDFQSHSMNHPSIFISDKLEDFYQPQLTGLSRWNFPLVDSENGGFAQENLPYGLPVYEFASRFSDKKRYFPDSTVQQRCVDYVKENGAEAFFKKKKWRDELNNVVETYKIEHELNDSIEEDNKQVTEILKELKFSRITIEDNLTGKEVRHFAWPWNQTGKITLKALIQSGYSTAYMGMTADELTGEPVEDFKLIKRVAGDFIKCLPGDGQQTFWAVLVHKIMRRLKSGTTY